MHHNFSLESIGATPEVWADFAPYAAKGFSLARVSLSIHDEYRLLNAAGELRGEPSGALLYSAARAADLPATGDWTAVRECGPREAIVYSVLPRRTCFSRRAAGTRKDEQVIAANVDTVLLVTGLDHDYNPRRIERYLALARQSGAVPVIVLNKADLCASASERLVEVRKLARGADVMLLSAHSPEAASVMRSLAGFGRTIALLGSSGAGKSTLINKLIGRDVQETGAVRPGDSRGRHTTTRRELIPIETGGAVIDTPGLREIQLWAGKESVDETFSEVLELGARCRFGDCRHGEEPGCAVREALASGQLDPARWFGYTKLLAEVKWVERATDPMEALRHKRHWKSLHKAQRALYRSREKH
jgi:ribosome biogenesis GTPase